MEQASNKFVRLAAIFGALAVGIGAFGAHGLKPHLTDYQVAIYEKGVQYQFYHSLALLAIGLMLQSRSEQIWLRRSGWLFVAGMLCFSGSLYLLACRDLLPISVAWAGPVTPIGGLCFIAGWLLMFRGAQGGAS